MEVNENIEGEALILSPVGRIDSSTAAQFQEITLGKISEGHGRLVIDFSNVDYISSAGLRVILMAAKRCKAANGGFAMCNLAAHIKEVFEISGFLKILTLAENQEDAISLV